MGRSFGDSNRSLMIYYINALIKRAREVGLIQVVIVGANVVEQRLLKER